MIKLGSTIFKYYRHRYNCYSFINRDILYAEMKSRLHDPDYKLH